jgi:hypothetical protein
MSLIICTILLTRKKLFFMLLIAGSMFYTYQAEYKGLVPLLPTKPELISHHEDNIFFIKNPNCFTAEQRLDFLHKADFTIDDGVSLSKQFLKSTSDAQSTISMMDPAMNTCTTEVTKHQKPVIETMEDAIASFDKSMNYLKNLTTSIIDKIKNAKIDVAMWEHKKVDGLTEELLEECIVKVAKITDVLNNSFTEAHNMMQETLDLATMAINDMHFNMNDNDALKESVVSAQIIISTKIEVTTMRLVELKSKVLQAQIDFEVLPCR